MLRARHPNRSAAAMIPVDPKPALRAAALTARARAKAAASADAGQAVLAQALTGHPGPIAGYAAIRDEIDPAPTLTALVARGVSVCLPVVDAPAQPLRFRVWTPDTPMAPGAFRVPEPQTGAFCTPRTLIVPLVAFDGTCMRLGYGGGFYDRTLAALRAGDEPVTAIGFAFAAQGCAAVPATPTDQPLDAIVTEAGVIARAGPLPEPNVNMGMQ
ncbi:MAG: 5-formyltetrahydrofolate cyclo-ligase [Pseudomonadota bacterium]